MRRNELLSKLQSLPKRIRPTSNDGDGEHVGAGLKERFVDAGRGRRKLNPSGSTFPSVAPHANAYCNGYCPNKQDGGPPIGIACTYTRRARLNANALCRFVVLLEDKPATNQSATAIITTRTYPTFATWRKDPKDTRNDQKNDRTIADALCLHYSSLLRWPPLPGFRVDGAAPPSPARRKFIRLSRCVAPPQVSSHIK